MFHEVKPARARGFTLVESLVALGIIAVLAAIAAPSFSDFVHEQRLSTTMGQLVGDLRFARTEAIKRNGRVLFCPRAAAGSTICATNTTNWQNGWLVCYDANGDDQCDASQATDVNPMRVGSVHPDLRLTGGGMMRFMPIGTTTAAVSLTLTGDWSNSSTRTGSVALTGFVSSRKN
jgi:type IV fimbrial biogenesis protein FimT